MSGLSTTNPDALNAKLVKFVPELDSPYARYPMKFPRWLDPKETDEKGRKCFIKSQKDVGPKPDYVWGPGKYGFGYYHLLCKDVYATLYSRVASSPPAGCFSCFSSTARQDMDAWDDVKKILYYRKLATQPDDGVAAKDGIAASRQTAKAWHNGLQNEQLMVGVVGAMNAS